LRVDCRAKPRVVKKNESSRRGGKGTGEILQCASTGMLCAFREACTFVRVDDEMHPLLVCFDNHANPYLAANILDIESMWSLN